MEGARMLSRIGTALVALAALAALSCKPQIGDECQISTDCSAAGDRLCDISAPNGYCTIFNCEPGSCPEDESLCLQFGWRRSSAPECAADPAPSPYARSFCMASCESDDDCRADYECADLSDPDNAWGALVIDRGRGSRACLVPVEVEPLPKDAIVDVCFAQGNEDAEGAAGSAAE
jgi:hypothetical protein